MKARDAALIVFGGALFGILFNRGFPSASSLWEAVLVGLVVMTPAAVAHRMLGERSTSRFLFVATLAGALIGMGIWWLTGRRFSWYLFAVPAATFAFIAAAFERLAEKRFGKHSSTVDR